MAKKKSPAPRGKRSALSKNAKDTIDNGLAGLTQFNPFGLPGIGTPGTDELSNIGTVFQNLRWYLVSNFRQVLSELFVEIGLVQTLCELPVQDALRGGVEIKSQQISEDQIKEIQVSMDRDQDLQVVGQAAVWCRLFGGAGVIILTDQDPSEPLDMTALSKDDNVTFRAVDMWELFWDAQNTQGYDPSIQSENFETYNYYGEKLHKSRVMRMKGLEAPSFIRPRLRGWGFSIVEKLVRSINQYLKGTDLGFQLLDEFKLDIYKIKNLVNTLNSPIGSQKVMQRMQMANYQKNYQNAIVMDSEDDFEYKQISMAGLSDAMFGIRKQVAADMRFPLTKLFGSSESGGIGNNDQNDMENYNSMVESEVRSKIKYDVMRIVEIKCQVLFGMIPDDLEIAFKPLRVLSAEQEENVKTQKFTRALQATQAGLLTPVEFRDICNKGDVFSVVLDNSGDLMNPNDPQAREVLAEGGNDPEKSKDIDNPGQGREDRPKSQVFKIGDYGGNKLNSDKRKA